jgi:dTDP-4-amino-4,6-dideoxygalactose transaminase
MIPCGYPLAQYLSHKEEILAAISKVLEGGRYILGEETAQFEKEFAAYIGLNHGIGVANGTDAITVALKACGIGPGDEVITVSHTAVATVAAIELTGATPVLSDIEPKYFTIDPEKVASLITAKTKAIIAVHIYGQSVDLEALLSLKRKHNLFLIEDCAQCHGAKYNEKRLGSFGDISCFSFYPTKNLGAIGDGGFVATNDANLAERARLVREYGWKARYESDIAGMNSRLDELQSAILRVKLRTLDADNEKRRAIAKFYNESLSKTDLILPPTRTNTEPVHHLYVVRSNQRDKLLSYLQSKEIGALIHYPTPVHLQEAYRGRIHSSTMVETERASKEIISLPIYPELATSDQEAVIKTIAEFYN